MTVFYSVEYIPARWMGFSIDLRSSSRSPGGGRIPSRGLSRNLGSPSPAASSLSPTQLFAEDALERIPDDVLVRIETEHKSGVTSSQILQILASHGIKLSEATLRKYIQLGLLPRSVRVGRKGKHQGSQGMYPASVVRQIQDIKTMMAADYTIEEIQRQILFVRGDIEELERTLKKIFSALKEATAARASETSRRVVGTDLASAEALATELVQKLTKIEQRLTAQAKLSKKLAG